MPAPLKGWHSIYHYAALVESQHCGVNGAVASWSKQKRNRFRLIRWFARLSSDQLVWSLELCFPHPQPSSISIPIGTLGMHSLDSQHFPSSRAPGFEHPLPATGGHSHPKAMDTGPVAALGLIGSFGHLVSKTSASDILGRTEIIPRCLMIGKNNPL
jgi:hypothetical protein